MMIHGWWMLPMVIAHGVFFLAVLSLTVLAIVWLVRALRTPVSSPDFPDSDWRAK